MIEVEIKCHLSDEQKNKLLQDAVFLHEETFVDTYFDTKDYRLSTNDIWLRTRNTTFVLKIPASSQGNFGIQKNTPKHEIEDESLIRTKLNLSLSGTLHQALAQSNIGPKYTFINQRQKYQKDSFIIDLDHAHFGTFSYTLCEIEKTAQTSEETKEILEQLHKFAQQHGITIRPTEGKLIHYIKVTNQEHYQALQVEWEKRISR